MDQALLQRLATLEGESAVRRLMVGPSTTSPWTVYIMADVDCHQSVIDACNLFRTTPVGQYSLWRYAKIEARIGRPLTIPDAAKV